MLEVGDVGDVGDAGGVIKGGSAADSLAGGGRRTHGTTLAFGETAADGVWFGA